MSDDVKDWPRWVPVHQSHIARKDGGDAPTHISVPDFADYHVNRATGEVTVMVKDEAEAARAAADIKVKAEPEPDGDKSESESNPVV